MQTHLSCLTNEQLDVGLSLTLQRFAKDGSMFKQALNFLLEYKLRHAHNIEKDRQIAYYNALDAELAA